MLAIMLTLPMFFGAGPFGDGDDSTTSSELQRAQAIFQGTWTFTSINDDGEQFGPELIHRAFAQDGRATVKGRTLSIVNPETGQRRTASLRLDPSKSPKRIDVINRNDRIYRGIYKLEGDDLVVCLDRGEDGPRPVDFTAAAGSGRLLLRLTPGATVKPASATSPVAVELDAPLDDPAAPPSDAEPAGAAAGGERRASAAEVQRAHQMLAGEWDILSILDDGSDVGPRLIRTKFAEDGRLRIGSRTASFVTPGTEEKHVSTIRVDPAKSPSWIDVTTQLDSVLKGIYRFDGDELVLCLAKHEDGARPTEFDAPSGSDRVLFRLAVAKSGSRAKTESRPAAVAPRPTTTTAAAVSNSTSTPAAADAKRRDRGRDRDQEVRDMLAGSWTYADRRGTVTLVLRPDGTFVATRTWAKAIKRLFEGQKSTSNGTWTYSHGTLVARVASTTSLSLAGHSFSANLQSIGDDSLVFKNIVGELNTARKLR